MSRTYWRSRATSARSRLRYRAGAPKFYDYIPGIWFWAADRRGHAWRKQGHSRRLENWSAVSIGSISMGQEVGVTPIQLISAVSGDCHRRNALTSRMSLRSCGAGIGNACGKARWLPPSRGGVIRPETAATLRRLMEGVVLNGTGKPAHLDGWTSAGKTGSAQKIDPATGRYSATQLIASFTGFCPDQQPRR